MNDVATNIDGGNRGASKDIIIAIENHFSLAKWPPLLEVASSLHRWLQELLAMLYQEFIIKEGTLDLMHKNQKILILLANLCVENLHDMNLLTNSKIITYSHCMW